MPNDKKATLLIVDDEPDNIAVLTGIMGSEYELLVATNGRKALQIAVTQKPDLILLDINMPEWTGFDVCQRLKADDATSKIPIIFVTALDADDCELRGLQIGGLDYITKPINVPIARQRILNGLTLKLQQDRLCAYVEELEKLNRQLLEERERTRTLRGLLPICCVCKKIRNDEGYWNQLESYISEHSEAVFSHGFCPECAEEAMRELKR